MFIRHMTMSKFESYKRSDKGQCWYQNLLRCWCGEPHYWWQAIPEELDIYWGLDSKFKEVTQRSTTNVAKTYIWGILLPVKVQHDEGKFTGVITFTRCCHMLPFDYDTVQKVTKNKQGKHLLMYEAK